MAANNAEVSSEALTGLQTDLTQLSNSLHEIFDLMNADMSQVGEAWRDGKYEEFVNGYRPQINKCEEISVRYHDWCTRILSPAIERVVEVEQSNVGGDGSGASVSSGSAAAGAGAAGAAGVATGAGVGEKQGFNMGEAIGKVQRKEATNKIVNSINNKPLTKADKMCQDIQPGSRARIVGKGESPDIEWTDEMSVTAANAERRTKAEAGLDIGVAKLGSDIELTEKSPVSSVTTTATKRAKCEMPEPKKIVKEK